MHTGHIAAATRSLGAPAGWNKDVDGPCGSLIIRDVNTRAGPAMTSAWYPTTEELIRIAQGAPIYLTVIGNVHPPVCMAVGPIPE